MKNDISIFQSEKQKRKCNNASSNKLSNLQLAALVPIFILKAKIHFFADELAYLQQSHCQLHNILIRLINVKSVYPFVLSNNKQNRLGFLNF